MHPLGFTCLLIPVVFIAAIACVSLPQTRKRLRLLGYGSTALLFLLSAGFSFMLHALHVGMSGDPADSPLIIALIITSLMCAPFLLFTHIRLRLIKPKLGQCPKCGYDLRGNRASTHCPECGNAIPLRHRKHWRAKSNNDNDKQNAENDGQ